MTYSLITGGARVHQAEYYNARNSYLKLEARVDGFEGVTTVRIRWYHANDSDLAKWGSPRIFGIVTRRRTILLRDIVLGGTAVTFVLSFFSVLNPIYSVDL